MQRLRVRREDQEVLEPQPLLRADDALDVPRRPARRPLHEVDQRLGDDLRIASMAYGRVADAVARRRNVGRRAQTPSGIIRK